MNWIGITITFLTIVTVIVCLLLVFAVLLQRPKNEGLGAAFGGDTASNIFGAQTTNVLATLTRWLGGIFMGLCIAIALLQTVDKGRKGKMDAYIEKERIAKQERDKAKEAEQAAKAAAEKANPGALPNIEAPGALLPGGKVTIPGTQNPPAPAPDANKAPAPASGTPAPASGTPAPASGTPAPATPAPTTPAPTTPAPENAAPATPPSAPAETPKPAESKPADSAPAGTTKPQ